MYTIEDAGLLKFDFLGIRNLSILATAIKIVKEKYGVDVDIEEIGEDDKETFEMLSRGETLGLFQLNGSGMTRFLKELKPSSVHDINAMVALYRPGPLEMIPEYIKRKHNPELITFTDPRLIDILDMSYGVIVYQDDVMLTAIHLAGYSWLEADKLRKAMGKKIPAEMAEQKEKLMKGFLANGLSKTKSDELWTQIEPFAAYGFNKAHAASYGRVAYQTAYMKAHYPHAYMTAIMTNESGDVDKIAEIVSECKRMGITVLPPDINESVGGFEIVKNNEGVEEIRFGLYTIKNFGVDIADAIINERNKNGKFTSLENFLNRITHKNLTKKSMDALAMCGALDAFEERNAIILNIESILEYHKAFVKDNHGQTSLFGETVSAPSFKLKKVTPATGAEKLTWEKELLGLYVSGFPLDPWKDKIIARNINIEKVHHDYADEFECSLAVLIETVKITKTKKGDFMALITCRDYTGVIEMAVFPKTYAKIKKDVSEDKVCVIKGKVASRNGDKTFIVDTITDLK
jgi:DNA polymerase-3 subunit alpha